MSQYVTFKTVEDEHFLPGIIPLSLLWKELGVVVKYRESLERCQSDRIIGFERLKVSGIVESYECKKNRYVETIRQYSKNKQPVTLSLSHDYRDAMLDRSTDLTSQMVSDRLMCEYMLEARRLSEKLVKRRPSRFVDLNKVSVEEYLDISHELEGIDIKIKHLFDVFNIHYRV